MTSFDGVEFDVDFSVGFDELSAVTRFDVVGFDVICIVDVEDDDVVVSTIGCHRETACLVCEELAVHFSDGHKNHVDFVVVWCLFVHIHCVHLVVNCGCIGGQR